MGSSDLDLCYMTGTEALAAFKARKLSPVELMKATIARCEVVNPKVNAITYDFYERALKQAKQAEKAYAKKKGAAARPLEGLPVAIKDFHPVKGEITTFGSKIFESFKPDYTAATVNRMLKAGAIMHIRSTSPEFAYSGNTRSPLWGQTRNPWNLDFGAGGSSGGAGAIIASGMSTLADGTDGGGSIRIPSSACGIVGYKPPYGRNPTDRDHPLESILHYGSMTRSVADAALMQNVTSGQHPDDLTSLPDKVTLPTEASDLKGFKVALSVDLGYVPVDPEVERNLRAAGEAFRSLGCKVEEVNLGWDWGVLDCWLTWWEGLFAGIAAHYLPRWRYEMDPFVVHLLEKGLGHSASRLYQCFLKRGEMWRKLEPIVSKYDVMICPTLAIPSVKVGHDEFAKNFTVNGKVVNAYVGWIMTHGFNLVSQCPSMSVPTGFSKSGVPTGMQIVARPYDDMRVFRAALAYEEAQPWRGKRPKL